MCLGKRTRSSMQTTNQYENIDLHGQCTTILGKLFLHFIINFIMFYKLIVIYIKYVFIVYLFVLFYIYNYNKINNL